MGDYEDRLAVKAWLISLRGDRTQDEVAALLGVSRKTVVNMENPKEGLPHGLTMVRYLRALGVVGDAPVELPGVSLLEQLAGAVAALTTKVDEGFEKVDQRLQGLETTRAGQEAPAPSTSQRKTAGRQP